eukprot:GILK01000515.1.p1 GENE.GILK01000515.1~~GILK01000515.1.p1  ORF type:complete len:380 (-),score=80.00 GILK01000515.1:161-1225(-)
MTEQQAEEARRAKELDKKLYKDKTADSQVVKLLLLGAGESGKSTVFKQLVLLYDKKKYTNEELMMYKRIIHNNTLQSMQALLANAGSRDGEILPPEMKVLADRVVNTSVDDAITPELAAAIDRLWNHPAIQATYARRADFQLNDSAKYYFEKVSVLAEPDYKPTEQDVLRSRVRTTGIVQTNFRVGDVPFHMYDVGGQRNERKKWIHCFENVTAVIFVASLSEYDQKLYEDENVNRMKESLTLFREICNSPYFKRTSMILFLNKKDLLAEKIVKHPFPEEHFPDYPRTADGRPIQDFETASEYIQHLYEGQCLDELKHLYCHTTCATDKDNVEKVFNACKDIMMRQNLEGSGFA